LSIKQIDRSTTVDKVVAVLRQGMFDGDLRPGDLLCEGALAQDLGVARNTIREALRVLATDGLVTRMPNRQLAVRRLSGSEIEDIFTARRILERESAHAAAYCPAQRFQPLASAFAAYAEAVARQDASAVASAHVDFHAAMVGLTGSLRLAEMERSLLRDLLLVNVSIGKIIDDLPRELDKHRRILALLSERKVVEALQCIEADLDTIQAAVTKYAVEE
jgi:DNA-binding GntR family transcriptional regulator